MHSILLFHFCKENPITPVGSLRNAFIINRPQQSTQQCSPSAIKARIPAVTSLIGVCFIFLRAVGYEQTAHMSLCKKKVWLVFLVH